MACSHDASIKMMALAFFSQSAIIRSMKTADKLNRLVRAAEGLMLWLGPWAEDYSEDEPQLRALNELRDAVAEIRVGKSGRQTGGVARWQNVSPKERSEHAKKMAAKRWGK